jgi:hypothetical protein
LENLDLGIVSDFGFGISNLITALPKQNKTPCVQQSRLSVKISFTKGRNFPSLEKRNQGRLAKGGIWKLSSM